MKYIDADRLRVEIEKIYKSEIQPWLSGVSATSAIYDYVLPLIDSLQQEQPELPKIERAEYYYHKGLREGFSQGHADVIKILDEFTKRKADPVIVIKEQEQPEVDLEKEIERYFEGWSDDSEYGQAVMRDGACAGVDECKDIARHFFNFGPNARK